MYPLIHFPTRITQNTCSLLDNIFTNNLDHMFTGVLTADISDHLPIFSLCHKQGGNIVADKNSHRVLKRNLSESNIIKFVREIEKISWIINGNPNDSYNCFLQQFSDCYNKCFPLEESVPFAYKSNKIRNKPWLTKDLLKKCNKKWILYKKYLKKRTEYRFSVFKNYRNMVNYELKKAKHLYFKQKFDNVKGDIKRTWNVLKDIMGTNKNNKKKPISEVNHNGNVIKDKNIMSDIFNDYFVNIGAKLRGNVQSSNAEYKTFLKSNEKSAFFTCVTPKEIIDIVYKLKNHSSPGFDHIDISVVKRVIHIICFPLCNIFNVSIEKGIFPDKMKVAKVIPVFKGGSDKEICNYRPISVLPVFSKILEKCFYNRLVLFLEECNILSDHQYGFRSGHSTSTALLELVNKVVKCFDNREIMLGLFLDLSKAFDTLDHTILLEKLKNYGIRGTLLNWCRSYLSDRKQYVMIDNCKSQHKVITCGIPQGSILGPLLFLIYMNDIYNISDSLHFIQFADDTSVFLSGNDPHTLYDCFNNELKKLYNWLFVNKLVLNAKKTNYMTFTKKHVNLENKFIKMGNDNINCVSSLKFLGVTIDNKLTWHEHIGIICNRMSKGIGILNRLRFLPKPTLKTIYNAFILPHLNYCNVAWGNSSLCYLNRIYLLQKKAVRIISNSSYRAHTETLFAKLKILSVFDLNRYNTGIYMYLLHKNIVPSFISSCFIVNQEIHNYSTRSSANYHIPNIKTNASKFSLFYQGPVLWNSFSSDIRNCPSLNSFKRKLNFFLRNSSHQ